MRFYRAGKSYPCASEGWGIFGPEALGAPRAWLADCLGERYESFQAADNEGNMVDEILWSWSGKSLSSLRAEPRIAIISCVWLRNQSQGKGVWKGMLRSFSESLKAQGAKGVLVAATDYEGYMHRSHFEGPGFGVSWSMRARASCSAPSVRRPCVTDSRWSACQRGRMRRSPFTCS